MFGCEYEHISAFEVTSAKSSKEVTLHFLMRHLLKLGY